MQIKLVLFPIEKIEKIEKIFPFAGEGVHAAGGRGSGCPFVVSLIFTNRRMGTLSP